MKEGEGMILEFNSNLCPQCGEKDIVVKEDRIAFWDTCVCGYKKRRHNLREQRKPIDFVDRRNNE